MLTVSQEIDLLKQMVFHVPTKGFCEKRDNSITLFYNKGTEMISLEYKRDAFMKVLRIFGEDVKKSYITIYGLQQLPYFSEMKTKIKWIEVEVTHDLAYKIIARHELNRASTLAGLRVAEHDIPFHTATISE